MPKRVATISTVVIREIGGKNTRVEVKPNGKAFNFTQTEIDDLNKLHPGALRKPINESVEEDVGEVRGATENADGEPKAPAKSKAKAGDKAKAPTKPAEVKTPSDDGKSDSAEDTSEEDDADDADADEDEDI